jgi:DMSO/TMAO reductase YedYZ molybdopterin-dependent catalytic subunit
MVAIVYGLVFVFSHRWILATQAKREVDQAARRRRYGRDPQEDMTRRTLLKQGAIAVGVVAVGAVLWRFITQGLPSASKVPVAKLLQGYRSKISPPPTPEYGTIQPQPLLSTEITSNDQFYIVSKNFTDPTVSSQGWSLQVTGQVEHPFSLNYQELLALPTQQQYETLECISNDVGGSYMSNALWQGVRLSYFLERAGVKSGSTKVVLHAYDDYADSIHLSKALETTTLVATHMNNVTLPDGHGYPARVLVPGIYGMKHVKWLTEIEVVNYDFQGYWQQRGWSDAAPVQLTSRIDTPLDGTGVKANQTTYIAGVAFSGNLGISEVDVSVDGGQTWQIATLQRPLSELTWVLWELDWQPTPGSYTIVVRAVDMEGNVQNPNEAPTAPNGATGYESISITAS